MFYGETTQITNFVVLYKMMSKIFLVIFLSLALISCDGGTSSNTETRRIENNSQSSSIGPADDGSTVAQINGATIRVDPDGNPIVTDDPTGEIEATRNPDGTITATDGDGSTVVFNPENNSVISGNP